LTAHNRGESGRTVCHPREGDEQKEKKEFLSPKPGTKRDIRTIAKVGKGYILEIRPGESRQSGKKGSGKWRGAGAGLAISRSIEGACGHPRGLESKLERERSGPGGGVKGRFEKAVRDAMSWEKSRRQKTRVGKRSARGCWTEMRGIKGGIRKRIKKREGEIQISKRSTEGKASNARLSWADGGKKEKTAHGASASTPGVKK